MPCNYEENTLRFQLEKSKQDVLSSFTSFNIKREQLTALGKIFWDEVGEERFKEIWKREALKSLENCLDELSTINLIVDPTVGEMLSGFKLKEKK